MTEFKPMVYTKKPTLPKILCNDEYKGHKVLILSFGTHPCAYIEDKLSSDPVWHDFVRNDLEVNGGVNFFNTRKDITGDDTAYMGWDYNHCWDYPAWVKGIYCNGTNVCEKTTEEMWEDCKCAVEQIIEMEKEVQEFYDNCKH